MSKKSYPSFESNALRGVLPVDKPEGMTSKDVSRWLVRRFGKLTLGHVGTLDPAASGVLPLLLGSATRVQDLLLATDKEYEFDVTFGYATDTLDRDGAVVDKKSADHLSAELVCNALKSFAGEITQIPPIYSAVKYRGQALHKYARQGLEAEVDFSALARTVNIYRYELLDWRGHTATLRVSCSKGTYVRVLAVDLAKALGTCGTVTRLRRIRSANLSAADCVSLPALEGAGQDWTRYLLPLERVKFNVPMWDVPNNDWMIRLQQGQRIVVEEQEFKEYLTEVDKSNVGEISQILLQGGGGIFGVGTVMTRANRQLLVAMRRGLS